MLLHTWNNYIAPGRNHPIKLDKYIINQHVGWTTTIVQYISLYWHCGMNFEKSSFIVQTIFYLWISMTIFRFEYWSTLHVWYVCSLHHVTIVTMIAHIYSTCSGIYIYIWNRCLSHMPEEEIYSIQHQVIIFTCDLRQLCEFLRVV